MLRSDTGGQRKHYRFTPNLSLYLSSLLTFIIPSGTRIAKKIAAPKQSLVSGCANVKLFPRSETDNEPCKNKQDNTACIRLFCTSLLRSSARSSSAALTRNLKSPRSRLDQNGREQDKIEHVAIHSLIVRSTQHTYSSRQKS